MEFKTFRRKHTSLALLTGLGVLSIYLTATPVYSDWSEPINLGPGVNSAAEDFAPHVSKNGLSLYFASTRPGGLGGEDLWVAKRDSTRDSWNAPVNLGTIINTEANERSPALSRDGHLLFFATTRGGGSGGFDIWVSWRHHTRDDFGWQTPVNLGTQFNTAATDAGPRLFRKRRRRPPSSLSRQQSAGRRRRIGHLCERTHCERIVRTSNSRERAQRAVQRPHSYCRPRWTRDHHRFQPAGNNWRPRPMGLHTKCSRRPLVSTGECRSSFEQYLQRQLPLADLRSGNARLQLRPPWWLRRARYLHGDALQTYRISLKEEAAWCSLR